MHGQILSNKQNNAGPIKFGLKEKSAKPPKDPSKKKLKLKSPANKKKVKITKDNINTDINVPIPNKRISTDLFQTLGSGFNNYIKNGQ